MEQLDLPALQFFPRFFLPDWQLIGYEIIAQVTIKQQAMKQEAIHWSQRLLPQTTRPPSSERLNLAAYWETQQLAAMDLA